MNENYFNMYEWDNVSEFFPYLNNNDYTLTTSIDKYYDDCNASTNVRDSFIESQIAELQKRNAELQTLVMTVMANDKKRQEEFQKIMQILKNKIKENE